MDWPELREEDEGWSMVFKTGQPTPEHQKMRRMAVFTPTDKDKRWVWAVHVNRHGVVTVTYCDHDTWRY